MIRSCQIETKKVHHEHEFVSFQIKPMFANKFLSNTGDLNSNLVTQSDNKIKFFTKP